MKKIVVGLLVTFLGLPLTLAHQVTPLEVSNEIRCKGLTHDGYRYQVRVQYEIDPTWLAQADPFEIRSGKRAYVEVKAWRNQALVYSNASFTNDLSMSVSDDETTYNFRKLEVVKVGGTTGPMYTTPVTDYVKIQKTTDGSSYFEFSIKEASGTFRNGSCI